MPSPSNIHREEFDGTDTAPLCPTCGERLEWQDCDACDGSGIDAFVMMCCTCFGECGAWVCGNRECGVSE